MQESGTTLAWILFWLFAGITTVATFLITDHHRSRSLAIGLSALSLGLFIALYFGLSWLLRDLGL